MEDTRKWAWRKPNDERAHGPFSSRDEALHDAWDYGDHKVVMVGRVQDFDPTAYLPDIDAVIEHIHDQATDSEWGWCEDALVMERDFKAAKEALDQALTAWAKEHLVPTGNWSIVDEEEVNLDDSAVGA